MPAAIAISGTSAMKANTGSGPGTNANTMNPMAAASPANSIHFNCWRSSPRERPKRRMRLAAARRRRTREANWYAL